MNYLQIVLRVCIVACCACRAIGSDRSSIINQGDIEISRGRMKALCQLKKKVTVGDSFYEPLRHPFIRSDRLFKIVSDFLGMIDIISHISEDEYDFTLMQSEASYIDQSEWKVEQ